MAPKGIYTPPSHFLHPVFSRMTTESSISIYQGKRRANFGNNLEEAVFFLFA